MAAPPIDEWAVRAGQALDQLTYRDWKFWACRGWTGVAIVSVRGRFPDSNNPDTTFEAERSAAVEDDTPEGVINAAMVAVLNLEVHEACERFRFADERPFDPHHWCELTMVPLPRVINKGKPYPGRESVAALTETEGDA